MISKFHTTSLYFIRINKAKTKSAYEAAIRHSWKPLKIRFGPFLLHKAGTYIRPEINCLHNFAFSRSLQEIRDFIMLFLFYIFISRCWRYRRRSHTN